MTAICTVSKRVRRALSLEESDLRALDDVARSLVPKLKLLVALPDGFHIEVPDLEGVLKMSNSAIEPIRSVEWKGIDADRYVNLSISSDSRSETASWHLTANDAVQLRDTSAKIEAALQGARPGFAVFAEREAWLWGFGVWGLLYLAIMLLPTAPRVGPAPEWSQYSLTTKLAAIGFLVAPLVLGGALSLAQSWLFPLVEFRTGYGKRRHSSKAYVRVGILMSLLVGVAGKVIAAMITK